MKANRAYKFRLYPNAEQVLLFSKTFGCVRFAYNKMLEEKIAYYQETGKMLRNTPAPLKKEYEWLKEVDSMALCNAQLQLQTAYANFFRDKNVGFPKFRSKKAGHDSYTTNLINGNIRIGNGYLRLPKAGMVRVKQHREIPDGYRIKSVTVSKEPSGKYYASILTEYECDPAAITVDPGKTLGLDYSSPHFYVDSDGNTADMPHFYRSAEARLAREQRKLSRMVRGSRNYDRQKVRLAIAYEKVRNSRKDWQHKLSTELADRYDMIAVEDIDYREMARDRKLSKATYDNGFGQFRTMLAYKMAERGKKLITIDKWYPSTKTCRHCGYVQPELGLKDREWRCPSCGSMIDRDLNAAINIRNQGLTLLA